jgi:hypothetical protein
MDILINKLDEIKQIIYSKYNQNNIRECNVLKSVIDECYVNIFTEIYDNFDWLKDLYDESENNDFRLDIKGDIEGILYTIKHDTYMFSIEHTILFSSITKSLIYKKYSKSSLFNCLDIYSVILDAEMPYNDILDKINHFKI